MSLKYLALNNNRLPKKKTVQSIKMDLSDILRYLV